MGFRYIKENISISKVFERNCTFIPEKSQVDKLYKKGILHMESIETTWANVAPIDRLSFKGSVQ